MRRRWVVAVFLLVGLCGLTTLTVLFTFGGISAGAGAPPVYPGAIDVQHLSGNSLP